jgi:hypothetical protein
MTTLSFELATPQFVLKISNLLACPFKSKLKQDYARLSYDFCIQPELPHSMLKPFSQYLGI